MYKSIFVTRAHNFQLDRYPANILRLEAKAWFKPKRYQTQTMFSSN